jgi:hypothetical protein
MFDLFFLFSVTAMGCGTVKPYFAVMVMMVKACLFVGL